MLAGVAYAEGRDVHAPPPSLRLYRLAKQLPGLWSGTDLMAAHGQLTAELMFYADQEAAADARRAEREREREARERRARRHG